MSVACSTAGRGEPGWMDGWIDGWTDGRMDGWIYGWMGAGKVGWGDVFKVVLQGG